MRKKYILGAAVIVTIAIMLLLMIRGDYHREMRFGSLGRNAQKQRDHESDQSQIKDYLAAFTVPISLFGKVVDQHGNPVPGANVKLTPFQNPFGEDNKQLHQITDADGKFSIIGLRGSAIAVSTSKQGYIPIYKLEDVDPSSEGMFEYSNKKTNMHTDASNPVIFTLHKVENETPVIHLHSGRRKLFMDGRMSKIALDAPKVAPPHTIECVYESNYWNRTAEEDAKERKYDWRFKMTIPGGGFAPRTKNHQMEAPNASYQESISIEMPTNIEKWSGAESGEYFVKFPDGIYGRVKFSVDGTSREKPLIMEAWTATKLGARELVSDQYIEVKID